MNWPVFVVVCLLGCVACSDNSTTHTPITLAAFERGPYAVGTTNMAFAAQFADMDDETFDAYLFGRPDAEGNDRFLIDLLADPEAAFITDVSVPNEPALYGPASGARLPVASYVVFPTIAGTGTRYVPPYRHGQHGVFEQMLAPGEAPKFADNDGQFPLILLAHGTPAHGLYDVAHAQSLASHGYIVAVMTFGDDRTAVAGEVNRHVGFLRPLLTQAVLDALLDSSAFGGHIDASKIGITGHSYGGFTALAIAGGPFMANAATVHDPRIKAAAIAAPWVGGHYDGDDVFAFGEDHTGLSNVTIPTICWFGTDDTVTTAAFIKPAMTKLAGPTYVVELVDQPHVFEPGSWQDRDNWEVLFFAAYLKDDVAALEALRTATSFRGGNQDVQLFDYQRLVTADAVSRQP